MAFYEKQNDIQASKMMKNILKKRTDVSPTAREIASTGGNKEVNSCVVLPLQSEVRNTTDGLSSPVLVINNSKPKEDACGEDEDDSCIIVKQAMARQSFKVVDPYKQE